MRPEDVNCPDNRGTTDSDLRTILSYILDAAAVASAAANAAQAIQLAQKEWDMAKRYWRITQNWMDYYQNSYAPVEDQEVREAMALTDESPIYETARGRARTVAWLQFREAFRSASRCTSKYCTGLRNDMLADLSSAQMDAVAMADGLGYRNERAYIETRSDERFKRQFETAKRGRNMTAESVSFAKAAANIYGNLFDQAWAGLTGAGQYLGYFLNRNETAYPNEFMQGRASFQRKESSAGAVAVTEKDRSPIASQIEARKLAAQIASGG